MYTIAFYSFKGGVGRTMALVNVAAELVCRGRKVLIVDFDLEAPGLETYQRLRPEKPHPGIVEYVTEFRRNFMVPNLLDFIYEAKPMGKKGGRLWVMPAGRRDGAYRKSLANLDWPRLYKDEEGFLLFEETKKGWEEDLKPDYVLIDSRTGDTDVLGICTRQLPDSVVLMFTPNEQNLAGLKSVCTDIRREEAEGRKIKLHFVAANVPDLDDERGILRRQIQAFKTELKFADLAGIIRRYDNLSLLDQSVFVLDRPHSKLARSYRRLLRSLVRNNLADREGAILFLGDYAEWMERRLSGHGVVLTNHNKDGTIAVRAGGRDVSLDGKKSLLEIARRYADDAEVLVQVADCFVKEEEHTRALNILDLVLSLNPSLSESLFQRAMCKIKLGEIDDAAEDLVSCLRSLDLRGILWIMDRSSYLIPASIEQLSVFAPARLSGVADLVESNKLDSCVIANIANCMCRTKEGGVYAARILRNHLAHLNPKNEDCILAESLLRARCWNELIKLLESKGATEEQKDVRNMLYLAFAYWGEFGAMPEGICREALTRDFGHLLSDLIQPYEAGAWFLWRIGRIDEALASLAQAEKRALGETDEIKSLWQFCDVTVEQYFKDCQLVRRMFNGDPSLRPAFLG